MGSSHILVLRAAGYIYECPECGNKNLEPYIHPNIVCGKCKAKFSQIKPVHVKGKDPIIQEQSIETTDSITF
jgi:hypothetical protein